LRRGPHRWNYRAAGPGQKAQKTAWNVAKDRLGSINGIDPRIGYALPQRPGAWLREAAEQTGRNREFPLEGTALRHKRVSRSFHRLSAGRARPAERVTKGDPCRGKPRREGCSDQRDLVARRRTSSGRALSGLRPACECLMPAAAGQLGKSGSEPRQRSC
jgi:hypothetical protein